jgi:hypothetical protein
MNGRIAVFGIRLATVLTIAVATPGAQQRTPEPTQQRASEPTPFAMHLDQVLQPAIELADGFPR